MTPARAIRVADFIRSELAHIVLTKMRDPRISMLSVTDARVSRDLAFADIYVSSLTAADDDARRQFVDVLNRASGFLRSAIAERHRMRTTPKLRFHYDHLIEEGPRLEALIDDATAPQPPRHFALRNRPAEMPTGIARQERHGA